MINKQNLWFITLFSLIIILGIYYFGIDNDVKSVINTEYKDNTSKVIEIEESDILISLEVEKEIEKETLLEEYQNILLSTEASLQEKSDAYDNIKILNNSNQEEDKIKKLIKKEFNYNSFVKITNDNIAIVIVSKDHNKTIANNIIRKVQELYNDTKYITIKFNQ